MSPELLQLGLLVVQPVERIVALVEIGIAGARGGTVLERPGTRGGGVLGDGGSIVHVRSPVVRDDTGLEAVEVIMQLLGIAVCIRSS